LFANGIPELVRGLSGALPCSASGFALNFAAGARKVAGFPHLFSSLVPRLPGDLAGMLASLTGNLPGLRAVLPITVGLMYVCKGAPRRKHRNQQHTAYRSRHTASLFKVQTKKISFCSENFR
jgi:hypothetical protein